MMTTANDERRERGVRPDRSFSLSGAYQTRASEGTHDTETLKFYNSLFGWTDDLQKVNPDSDFHIQQPVDNDVRFSPSAAELSLTLRMASYDTSVRSRK